MENMKTKYLITEEELEIEINGNINANATIMAEGAEITAFDPVAMDEARQIFTEHIHYADSAQACLDGADGAIVVTEWNEFRALTPQLFTDLMTGNILIDLRNIYEPEQMKAVGLNYQSIGRPEA